jgi:hypothetical protein
MEVVHHKNIFINSEQLLNGDGQNLEVLFPPDAFSTSNKDETMRLTLNSFTMRRNFYAINQHNNVFYSGTNANTQTKTYTIPPGDYSESELETAIETLLDAEYSGATCEFQDITRTFKITMPVGFTDIFWSSTDLDTHEILGGTPDELFDATASPIFTSKFPVQLDSISDIYLRTSLQSSNFQTNKGNNHLGNTDIFARIPIYKDGLTLADTPMVKWEDSNDLYSIHIQNHQLSNVRFMITDDKHRALPVTQAQRDAHNLNFKMTFKYEILRRRETTPPPPLGYVQNQKQFTDYRNDYRF